MLTQKKVWCKMIHLTKSERRYANILPATANFMLGEKQFKKWIEIRWKLILAWHKNKQENIFPCMYGEHYIDGRKFEVQPQGKQK